MTKERILQEKLFLDKQVGRICYQKTELKEIQNSLQNGRKIAPYGSLETQEKMYTDKSKHCE